MYSPSDKHVLQLHFQGMMRTLMKTLICSHRWFTHFYVVSVLWNGFLLICLFQAEFLGESLPSWIQDMHHALGRDSQSKDMGKYSRYYNVAI